VYRPNLLSELSIRPLLADGAMGTELLARGLPAGSCCEQWNLDRCDEIESIHRGYVDAGCDLLTTNTFQGSSVALSRQFLESHMREINLRGALIARRAAGEGLWILGDVGPIGDSMKTFGQLSAREVSGAFAKQASALRDGGIDAICIETMSDPQEMAIAIKATRRGAELLPIIATYAFGRSAGAFVTLSGATVREAIGRALEAGADVVGANCGTLLSLQDCEDLAEQIVSAAQGTPVIMQPNAGTPVQRNGKITYAAAPSDMAALVTAFLDIGVQIVGGCCGTTPAHTRAMAHAESEFAKARKD
jgi:5-methyltetrahydrofolate--homocysteine methyltransferase